MDICKLGLIILSIKNIQYNKLCMDFFRKYKFMSVFGSYIELIFFFLTRITVLILENYIHLGCSVFT